MSNIITTTNDPITSFDQLPTEAKFLLAIISMGDCARLGLTKAPAEKRLMTTVRMA